MSMDAGSSVWTGDRRKLSLGALLKSGGAGGVYRLRESAQEVAKIYHDSVDRGYYERKVAAMVKLSPHLPDLAENGKRYVQIAWPEQLLRDDRGRFLGFVMPVVDIQATSELECILQERQARAAGLPVGLGVKVTLAANLAAVITELHKQRHHVIDLKPVNLRFYPQSLYMAMLDCDGFSIQGEGERFDAPQFTPDYLAPEFQRGAIPVAAEEQQDCFALAVVIFQLLNFGIHPFTGRPSSDRVPTDIPSRIANRCYAYGLHGNSSLAPSMASGHAALPLELRQLFDRAFESAGATRPPALEWAAVLRGYAQRSSQRLIACSKNPEHQHFAGLPCAACNRDALIASTAQKNALAARNAASPIRAVARAIGVRSPRPAPTRVPVTRPNPRYRVPTWRPSPPPPAPVRPPSQSSSLFNTFRVVLLVLLIGFRVLPGLFSTNSSSTSNASVPASSPAPAQVPATAPMAATPPATPTPNPSANGLPAADWYGALQDMQDATERSEGAAVAFATGNKFAFERSMAYLRAAANGHPKPDMDAVVNHQYEFGRFHPTLDASSETSRLALMAKLRDVIAKDRYDAEAAYEWGWLDLFGGDNYQSKDAFVRAIWADPDHAAAWYGYGVAAHGGDEETIGAMAIAETLFDGPFSAQHERKRYSSGMLQRLGINPKRFRLLQARAQKLAVTLKGGKLPPNVEAQAKKPLPPR